MILEEGVRLSQSRLWQWQRRYYDGQGSAAWRHGSVPHFVTSNSLIAESYAKVVLAFLRDCAQTLDLHQPVHIVEFGAGVGRFGFHFLSHLQRLLPRSKLAGVRVRYVLTDFTEANLAYYRSHSKLRPLFAAGLLDCARFDFESDSELTLLESGETLSAGRVANPVIFIANYVLDTVRQDAFLVTEGRLHETLLTLSTEMPEALVDSPAILQSLEINVTQRPIELPCYEDPAWNRILDGYARRGINGGFLFPVAALSCMARMRALGGDRLLFLTADKGYHALDDVCRKQPGWSVHGSFSLYVNYHALSEWVQHHGGQAVHSVCREPSLSVNAFLFGVKDPIETQLAFDFNLGRGGSPDLFLMKSALESRFGTLSLEQTLAIVRLWAWDSAVFLGCLVELRQRLASTILTAGLRADLLYTLDKVREHHFPIGETPDLETEIAHLIQEIEKLAQ